MLIAADMMRYAYAGIQYVTRHYATDVAAAGMRAIYARRQRYAVVTLPVCNIIVDMVYYEARCFYSPRYAASLRLRVAVVEARGAPTYGIYARFDAA